MRLSSINFVDMYVGEDFCDVKGWPEAETPRAPAPLDISPSADELRALLLSSFEEHGQPEFALAIDNLNFRVTAMLDVKHRHVFVLRRSNAVIRPLAEIGLPPLVVNHVIHRATRGLVLISGDFGAGKTSTAASMMRSRVQALGEIGVVIEDPPETNLDGLHGPGRCIQLQASSKNGSYSELLKRALRSGADAILIGEIRDRETAQLVVRESLNGNLIITTMHALGVTAAIDRLASWSELPNAHDMLSYGLSVAIWQRLETGRGSSSFEDKRTLHVDSLVVAGKSENAIRQKIRSGNVGSLKQEMLDQATAARWG